MTEMSVASHPQGDRPPHEVDGHTVWPTYDRDRQRFRHGGK